jgi:hypothetical protein
MKKIFIYILVFIALSSQWVFAQKEAGTSQKKYGQSSMTFLQVGVVPEAVSMGGAWSAYGTGTKAMFYNVAGLDEMSSQTEVYIANTQWIADIQYLVGAAAVSLGEHGTVGINFLTIDYGDIIGTQQLTSAEAAVHQKGYIETGLVDNVGAFALGLYYSKSISNSFLIGIGARYIDHQLGTQILNGKSYDNQESKFAFDLGVKYYTPVEGFRFGMSIRNFSTEVKFEEITAPLPITFSFGVAMDFTRFLPSDMQNNNALILTSEFSHPNNSPERVHTGFEYLFMKMFALRAGYISNHDVNGLSLGVGFNTEVMGTNSVSINYSYSRVDNYFNDVNRFSVMFSF